MTITQCNAITEIDNAIERAEIKIELLKNKFEEIAHIITPRDEHEFNTRLNRVIKQRDALKIKLRFFIY